jgi:membrane peptidoglycan carboxypeptidase
MTPLQLGAMVSAIANGGTLYYVQHPDTPEEIANFQPRVKRHLDIAPIIPEISDGMAGAVQYGTARSVRYNFSEEQVLGKTGTCSRSGTRYGWFASYANTDVGRIVTVVFLQGGRPTFGPRPLKSRDECIEIFTITIFRGASGSLTTRRLSHPQLVGVFTSRDERNPPQLSFAAVPVRSDNNIAETRQFGDKPEL